MMFIIIDVISIILILFLWSKFRFLAIGVYICICLAVYAWYNSLDLLYWDYIAIFLIPTMGLITVISYLQAGLAESRACRNSDKKEIFTVELTDENGKLHYIEGLDRGIAVIGAAGAGKTQSVIYQIAKHHAKWEMSGFIHDYKNFEFTSMLYPLFKDKNIKFNVFALHSPEHSIKINPIDPEYLQDEDSVKSKVETFLVNVQGRESSSSMGDFFNNATISLLSAIIWYLRCYYPGLCNFPFVCALLLNPDNLHIKNAKGTIVEPYGKIIKMIRSDEKTKAMASGFLHGIAAGETTANIMSTIALSLQAFNTSSAFYLMSENEMDLRLNLCDPLNNKYKEIISFVNDPDREKSYSPIIAVLIETCYSLMGQPGREKAFANIDEAPRLKILGMEKYLSTVRSFGICTIYCVQDMKQMQAQMDGKSYNVAKTMANLSTQFYGKCNQPEAAEYYEKCMPEIEVREKSYSDSSSGNAFSKRSVTTRMRQEPMFKKDKFYSLLPGEFIKTSNGKVERFRFKYDKNMIIEMPPPIRTVTSQEMDRKYSEMMTLAHEFINNFK